jgi:hypothetical protein
MPDTRSTSKLRVASKRNARAPIPPRLWSSAQWRCWSAGIRSGCQHEQSGSLARLAHQTPPGGAAHNAGHGQVMSDRSNNRDSGRPFLKLLKGAARSPRRMLPRLQKQRAMTSRARDDDPAGFLRSCTRPGSETLFCVSRRRLWAVRSTGQCNTACSLSAGVSKPKVFRGR